MTSNENQKLYLFFDTNSLESRFAKDCLFLSKPEFSKIFYFAEQFIKDNKLEDSIKICIPEISLLEIKKHLVSCFQSNNDALNSDIEKYRKIFGDLFEIYVEKKVLKTKKEYEQYIEEYYNNFIDERKEFLEIISYPKDEETFKLMINKALYSIRPFVKANKQGKEYSDAGLKDAMIYESIIQYLNCNSGILITNDNDFKEIFSDGRIDNLKLCSTEDELKALLLSSINMLNSEYRLIKIISNDDYFIKTLLAEVTFDVDANYKFYKVIKIVDSESGMAVNFVAVINGEKYEFEILYELNSNTLLEVIAFGDYDGE